MRPLSFILHPSSLILSLSLLLSLLVNLSPAYAAPPRQDDPEELCRQGVSLFRDGRQQEALPLLEAGMAGGTYEDFRDPNDLGWCAGILGQLRNTNGDASAALELYLLALDIFQRSGHRQSEGFALGYIGGIYRVQGRLVEALDAYQQALSIWRELEERRGEGITLYNLGLVYEAQGRYDEAWEQYQQALDILRAVGDRRSEGIILNNLGLVYEAQGRWAEALEQYQQALTIMREVGDRMRLSRVLANVGRIYSKQGHMAKALDAYQQALIIMREVGDHREEGTTLNNIGNVYHNQGRYAEALDYYLQALTIAREVGDRPGESNTLNNLGNVYHNQGRYAEALEQFQQALAIMREVGNRSGEGTTLNNIGNVYHNQGRYAETLDYYQQALSIAREVGDRWGEGGALNNIGGVYHAQGRYAEALEQYQQVLTIMREVSARPNEGSALHNVGVAYHEQGRYAEALDYYQQGLAIHREVGNRREEGLALSNIGEVYADQGRYAEALDTYQQALAIQREVGDRPMEGTTLNNIGEVYRDQGRLAEALNYYQQALDILREVGNMLKEGVILHNLGFIYAAQGRSAEALEYYQQAMERLEAVRASAGSDAARASFIAQYAGLYEQAALLAAQQGQGEAAFFTSERGRARAFLDGLATGYVQLADDAAQQLFAHEQESYRVRQAALDALITARSADPPDAALVVDLEAQLAAADVAYADALQAIVARGDELAALVPSRSEGILAVADVQARLDPQTTLVSFFVSETESLAFVLTRTSFTTVVLEVGQSELADAVTSLRSTLSPDAPAHDAEQTALYQTLFAPLAAQLTTPHLALIPHGPLHYLPFAALSDGKRYLGEQFTLSFLPSASVLPFIQANQGRPLSAPLVLGNPDGSLPAATREAQTIAQLFGTEPLLGAAASKRALHERVAAAGILHLAAHGSYNPVAPLLSHLALAPSDGSDGNLEAGEVYSLDLGQSSLVVLSACESNLGARSAGDELVGLTRAFFFAGTPTVVSSLWRVDDAASALLMERFYGYLQAGVGKAQALQQAQADVRTQYPAPYYWAGFVLSGEAGSVATAASAATTWWLWLAAGLVLLVVAGAGGVLVWRRRVAR